MLFSKKHKIGDTISQLRKEKGWTQAELANKLQVSDKAVSKWESNKGEPSIEFLPILAQLFDVSLDYLMTGKEKEDKIITISRLELCAKKDDVAMYRNFKIDSDYKDENGKTIFHYVFDYESKKLFTYLIENNEFFTYIEYYGDDSKTMEKFYYMEILCNDKNIINDFLKLDYINATNNTGLDDRVYRYINYKNTGLKIVRNCLSDRIIDKIVYDKNLNKAIKDTMIPEKIFSNTNLPISFPYIIYYVIRKKDYKLALSLLKKSLEYNEKQADQDKNDFNNVYGRGINYYKNFVNLPKEVFDNLLENEQYDLIDIANKVNTKKYGINHRPNLFQMTQYDIDSNKINHNSKLSKKEKDLQLCIHNGIICLDELIALNDYDLYEKTLKKYPANEYEIIFEAIKNKDYRKIFEYAVQHSITSIIDAIRNKKLDLIEENFCKYIRSKHSPSYGSNKIILSSDINKEYYTIYKRNFGLLNIKDKDNELSYQKFIDMKNKVILSKVLDKDIRFIEKACKTATQKELDEALTKIAPNNFKGIKILLNAGAKLHKTWREDDGWGYIVDRDEIDEIGTEILKKKINDILKEKK